jgi:hypothetical protein
MRLVIGSSALDEAVHGTLMDNVGTRPMTFNLRKKIRSFTTHNFWFSEFELNMIGDFSTTLLGDGVTPTIC